MTQDVKQSPGFLGRGPIFWLAMTFATTATIAGLALTNAIDNKAAVMILMLVPIASMVALFRSMLNNNAAKEGNCVNKGQAQRRYIKRVAMCTSLYLATFAAMTFMDELFEVPQAVRFIIASLPGFAVIGIFWAIGRLIVEETDEFIRMLTIRQTLVASALSLSAASIWGFLEAADLVMHVDAYWWPVAWFLGLFVGAVANRIEYGTWGAA